jgi:hypothetical protein
MRGRISLTRNRITRWAALAGGALLAGSGLGFVARDLLGLGQPAVAFAWLAGVVVVLWPELAGQRLRD